MKFIRRLSVVLVLGFLVSGCGHRTAEVTPPVDVQGEELFPFASDSQSLYEQNRHLFDYEQGAPLEVQEGGSRRGQAVTWYDITYASPKGGRVPASLIVPDGKGPFADLVVLHTMPAESVERYARWGAVVILVDPVFPKMTEEGALPSFTEEDREGQIQVIIDLRRAIDVLVARPEVDPDRIAYLGISTGGATGGLLAGIEDRLRAYVLIVGDGGWVTHFTVPENQETFASIGAEQNPWIAAIYWPWEAAAGPGAELPGDCNRPRPRPARLAVPEGDAEDDAE